MGEIETSSAASTFSAWFDAETTELTNPDTGVVNVHPEQLRFENDSVDAAVSLSAIRDIRVDYVPNDLGPFPPGQVPITVVYGGDDGDGNGITAATIAASGDVIRPFTTELLETLLTGVSIQVRHPVKFNQEPVPSSFKRGTLVSADRELRFKTGQNESVHTANVSLFERVETDGASRHPVRITASRGDIQYQTDIQLPNSRTAAILGRYLSIQTRLNPP